MLLIFELSMPGVNSWDGKWSGSANLYAKVVSIRNAVKAKTVVDAGRYSYSFGDGWHAAVSVRTADSKEAARVRRRTNGFCGYDWMIDSIVKHGDIRTNVTEAPNNG